MLLRRALKTLDFWISVRGSGAVGIEALSRGASHATFVDRSRRSCQLIEANLELCRMPEEQHEIYCSEASEFLRQTTIPAWDIIFFDPPYKDDYLKTLELPWVLKVNK